MPNYVGGDIEEIVCKHATLGEFRFQAKSNESFTLDPGGLRSNDDANEMWEFLDNMLLFETETV